MGLTQKILLFTSALIIALAGITLTYTTIPRGSARAADRGSDAR